MVHGSSTYSTKNAPFCLENPAWDSVHSLLQQYRTPSLQQELSINQIMVATVLSLVVFVSVAVERRIGTAEMLL